MSAHRGDWTTSNLPPSNSTRSRMPPRPSRPRLVRRGRLGREAPAVVDDLERDRAGRAAQTHGHVVSRGVLGDVGERRARNRLERDPLRVGLRVHIGVDLQVDRWQASGARTRRSRSRSPRSAGCCGWRRARARRSARAARLSTRTSSSLICSIAGSILSWCSSGTTALHAPPQVAQAEADHGQVLHRAVVNVEREAEQAPLEGLGARCREGEASALGLRRSGTSFGRLRNALAFPRPPRGCAHRLCSPLPRPSCEPTRG